MFAIKKLFKPHVLRYCRRIATSGRLASEDLMTHRDTNENNSKTLFKFSQANLTRIHALMSNYPDGYQRSVVSAALELVQRQIGWIPISAMLQVADMLNMPRMRVFEVATFYSMKKRRYRGRYNVRVCVSTPCMLRGSDELLEAVESICSACAGENSADGMFGVDKVFCQGACANAPVMVIDDDYYEDMTILDAVKIIKALKNGNISPAGPQSGRHAAEPYFGVTTLTGPLPAKDYKLHPDLQPKCNN